MTKTLFLDFDGVLHPSAVYVTSGPPRLAATVKGELFQWAPLLEQAIAGTSAEIVIASSWVRYFGFTETVSRLPLAVRERVVGTTYDERFTDKQTFDRSSRYRQIRRYVDAHQVERWVAIDDLNEGEQTWPQAEQHRLVLADPQRGLSASTTLAALAAALR